MNSAELRSRIQNWEDLHTEFKLQAVHPDDLSAAIVAFANSDGGQLIIGVSNDRRVVGITDSDKLRQYLENVALNNCVPPVSISLETVADDMAQVLVVTIPKGDQRPYRTNRGVYYLRTSSGRRPASREELLRLFQATESMYYDETPLVRLGMEDLDLDAVRAFVEQTRLAEGLPEISLERLLRNWRLMSGNNPTIAGLILFGRDPQQHLPFAQINAARIPGTELANEPLDRKDFTGRLLDLIDEAMRFLYLHLAIPHKIQGLEPEPRPELPNAALREAIINAVAHRDYTVHGPIRLFIFDDRVEFHSPGKPPNTVERGSHADGRPRGPEPPHLCAPFRRRPGHESR